MTFQDTVLILKRLTAYPYFQVNDSITEEWFRALKGYDPDVVNAALDRYIDTESQTPTPADIRKLIATQRRERKALREEIERKFRDVPGLQSFILQAFETYFESVSSDEQQELQERIANISTVLWRGDWRAYPCFIYEVGVIMKERQQAGIWTFPTKAFQEFQANHQQQQHRNIQNLIRLKDVKSNPKRKTDTTLRTLRTQVDTLEETA